MASFAVKHYEFNLGYLTSQYVQDGNHALSSTQQIVESSINKLLSSKPMDKPFNLVVRWGWSFGLGDVSHACKVAKLVKEHFPGVHIFLTCDEVEEAEIRLPTETKLPLKEFETKELHELFLGIQAPLALPGYLRTHYFGVPTIMLDVATPSEHSFPFEPEDLGRPRRGLNLLACYHVDEYNGKRFLDNVDESDNISTWYSAGLGLHGPSAALCTGIHVDKQLAFAHLPYSELSNLKDKKLAYWFKQKAEHPPEFYFSYFSPHKNTSTDRFVDSILNYEKQFNRDVDILMLAPNRFITKDNMLSFLEANKFQSIEFIWDKWSKTSNIVTEDMNATAKLRIILWTIKIPREDVLMLMKATGRALLVSGDQSLAEAISLKDRVIFYQTQTWKRNLSSQIRQLAAYRYGEGSRLCRFYALAYGEKCLEDEVYFANFNEIAEMMNDPIFIMQHKDFMEFLTTYYDINEWLIGKLNRHLVEFYVPKLLQDEHEIAIASSSGTPRHAKRAITALAKKVNTWTKQPDAERSKRTRRPVAEVTTKRASSHAHTYEDRLKRLSKVQRLFFPDV